MKNYNLISNRLITKGLNLLKNPKAQKEFTTNRKANELLNNFQDYPHAFVLACVMDRQIDANRAWLIPFQIANEIGNFEFPTLLKITLGEYIQIFESKKLHRFNQKMATCFFNAIKLIQVKYQGNASKIWNSNPKSGKVVRSFLEIDGVGLKIATMATNILVRDFKIPMKDYNCIDISPDVQIQRVFKRIGFISKEDKIPQLLYCAREINPEYPGVFDFPAWEIGKNWCKPKNPDCKNCYLKDICPKVN
jgi:endonuclease III